MAEFQDTFLQDLWQDMLLRESRSLLCGYFREEKRRHPLVQARKARWEGLRASADQSTEAARGQGALAPAGESLEAPVPADPDSTPPVPPGENQGAPARKRSSRRPRKSAREHPCVELLCRYYDFLQLAAALRRQGDFPGMAAAAAAFREQLRQSAEEAKVSRKRRQPVLDALRQAEESEDGQLPPGFWEQALGRTIDLHVYAEAAQFLYNAGLPLPPEDGKRTEDGIPAAPRRNPARIKTVPLKLLDYYFHRKGLSLEELSSVSRMSAAWIAGQPELQEKLEDVYDFACDNRMTRAVIPLLLDNASGTGLYVLGSEYLQSWKEGSPDGRKVQEILRGRSCCYAIVRFLNLELEEDGQYFWAPYSVVDLMYEKCDTNPESILFGDLDKALNIYSGQLHVTSQDILYENYRSENVVHIQEDAVALDPEFRKYFQILEEEDDLEAEIRRSQSDYRRRLAQRYSS